MKNKLILCLVTISFLVQVNAQTKFVHPGVLHSKESLDRMSKMVKQEKEPWLSGFEALKETKFSSSNYVVQGGCDSVSRDNKDDPYYKNYKKLDNDCLVAYYNALMWVVTKKKAHADKSIEILNAWSYKLKAISGKSKPLLAGFSGAFLVNAAEIMRYTNSGWKPEDIAQCEKMFLEKFYPAIKKFSPGYNGNWGNAGIKTVMGIGVFCNNRKIYDEAVNYYLTGERNASLQNYVYESGQCQESGRDQQHSQLGLGNLAEACETAFNQGQDLYSALDNRLLKGFEYTAKYNLGENVPYAPIWDADHAYHYEFIAESGRGDLRPIFEMVFNHYVNRKGTPAPYTQLVAEQNRPEKIGKRPTDQPSFGTLTFSLKEISN